jgi:Dolichyl-phosphate-mannose-protein mannosyltransferase
MHIRPRLRIALLLVGALGMLCLALSFGGPRQAPHPVLVGLRWSFVALALIPLLLALAQIFRLHVAQRFAIVSSLVPLLGYWARTPWNVRGHDVGGDDGHLGYVLHIVRHGSIPSPQSGWTFYHPPLYYGFGALVVRLSQPLGIAATDALQALSLCLWLVFLAASSGAIRLSVREPRARLIATLSLAFWPSGVMHAVRIGNDLPLYATAAVATWFMLLFWRHGRWRDLALLSLFTGLAVMSKSNALVLVVAFGLLIGMTSLFQKRAHRLANIFVFLGSSAVAVGLNFAMRADYYRHTPRERWLVGNGEFINPALRVPSSLGHLLVPDLPVYLSQPWLNTFSDATGRGRFWNALWRSSLSGEFHYGGAFRTGVALLWGGVLLALLILGALRWLRTLRTSQRFLQTAWLDLPWMILSLTWLASLFALRIQMPFACSNDFRYVLPVLVPAVIAWSRSGRLALMVVTSALFFVTLG